MAIAAVDAVVTDVVLMAKGHRLFERFIQAARIVSQRTPQKDRTNRDNRQRQQPHPEVKPESPMEKLCHVNDPVAFCFSAISSLTPRSRRRGVAECSPRQIGYCRRFSWKTRKRRCVARIVPPPQCSVAHALE